MIRLGFNAIFNPVVYLVEIFTIPAFCLIELLNNSPADGLAAHVHGDEPGCEIGAIFIPVYLLENEAKNGCVMSVYSLPGSLRTFTGKIIGIQEQEQVIQCKKVHLYNVYHWYF